MGASPHNHPPQIFGSIAPQSVPTAGVIKYQSVLDVDLYSLPITLCAINLTFDEDDYAGRFWNKPIQPNQILKVHDVVDNFTVVLRPLPEEPP